MRLQTYIKNNANKTKREVVDLYHEGRILVNNKIIPLPTELLESDVVTIDGEIIQNIPFVYYLYNKPIGIECTNDSNKKDNIKDHLQLKERVYTVGRLDKASRGLIILTNDNQFCHQLIGKETHVKKEYVVGTKEKIDDNFIEHIKQSVTIRNKQTKECEAYKIDEYHFGIILNEGMYHQIRKMVIFNHNSVIDLKRIKIGPISLSDYTLEEDQYIKIDHLPRMFN